MKLMNLLFVLLFSSTVFAQRIVTNPTYSFRNSGIPMVTKLEFDEEGTRLHLRCTYKPNWWVRIDSTAILQESGGDRIFKAKAIEGTTFNKKSFTPKSGYQDFIITFDPVDKDIDEIDFLTEKWKILNIATDEKYKSNIESKLPRWIEGCWSDVAGENGWTYGLFEDYAIINHRFWTYEKINFGKKKCRITLKCDGDERELYLESRDSLLAIGESKKNLTLYTKDIKFSSDRNTVDLSAIDVLKSGKMVLQGYFENYNPNCGFQSGLVYSEDVLARHNQMALIEINEDGRFYAELDLAHAGRFFYRMGDRYWQDFYAIPGDTLTIYLNWEKILESDLHPNNPFFSNRHKRFMGEYARLEHEREELRLALSPSRIYDNFKKDRNLPIDEYHTKTNVSYENDSEMLNKFCDENNISNASRFLSEQELVADYADIRSTYLRVQRKRLPYTNDFENGMQIFGQDFSSLPDNFFDVYKGIDADNRSLMLMKSFGTFINRYEFLPYRKRVNIDKNLGRSFIDFLEENERLSQSELHKIDSLKQEQERQILSMQKNKTANIAPKAALELVNLTNELFEKNKDFAISYPLKKNVDRAQRDMKELERMSAMFWSTENSFVSQVTASRSFFKVDTSHYLNGSYSKLGGLICENLTNPIIAQKLSNHYAKYDQPASAIQLVEGEGKELFEKIIAPHKGKYVIVDFWAVGCGPCVMGIKRLPKLQEQLKGKNISFVFITDQRSSPLKQYNEIMAPVVGDKYYLTSDEWNQLAALFSVNGIPRYVLVGKDGKVQDDDFRMYDTHRILSLEGL